MLPEGDWKASESEAIAARLVNWLPGQVPQAIPLLQGEYVDNKRTKLRIATALAWGVLAAALLFFTLHLFSNNNFAFGHEAGVSIHG
jgi:hypothetical protein